MRVAREWATGALVALTTVVPAGADPAAAAAPPEDVRPIAPPSPVDGGTYVHLRGAASLGKGMRFNNPYRLRTQLGSTGESLSLSATYLDVAAGATFGDPDGIQHGLAAALSIAIDGIPQEVLTPSYLSVVRLRDRFLIHARGGLPAVLEPDFNVGIELAAGGAWLYRSGLGLTAELVYDLFYGAATLDTPATAIPLLSIQVGLLVDYEVLP